MREVDPQDKDILLKYLGQATESENAIRNTTRTTMNYYSTLLLSLTGGILLISKDLKDMLLFGLCYLLGGFILVVIPAVAVLHYKSDYRRQIEMVTIQAKIEDILGFTDVDSYTTTYWNHEPIVPPLYLRTRNNHHNSSDFVDTFLKATDVTYVRIYYRMFQVIGIAYMVIGYLKLSGHLG